MINNANAFDYYAFRIDNVREKINDEIAFYEECEFVKYLPISQYLTYLKGRITSDKMIPNKMMHYDKSGNKCEIKKMNIDEYGKFLNELNFKKPWKKLKEFHKIMKIKEYVDNLEYRKGTKQAKIDTNRDFIKKELIDGIKSKKFVKDKCEVIYDQENMMIMNIDCVMFNKKSGVYEIDWD